MIIRGNTVGCAAPRADYAQNDPKAADYIKNKPDEAIRKAQEAADQAQETASAALPASGGDVTGEIHMNGNPVSGLVAPAEDTQAANKAYVDASLEASKTYADDACGALKTAGVTLSLPASGWVGDTAPFTQTVSVDGLAEGKRVMVYPDYGDDTDANLSMREACSLVSYAKRDGGSITFTCLEDKPGTDIHIVAEVYV